MHILVCIWATAGGKTPIVDGSNPLFFATFFTSVFSAAFGMAKFLKNGPCRVVPSIGCLSGYGHLGFIFVFVSILFVLVGKGLALAFVLLRGSKITKTLLIEVLVGLCFNWLPQVILVST